MDKPKLINEPDLSRLHKVVEAMFDDAVKRKYWDEDFDHYIYEETMMMLYGRDFFKWRNAQEW